jgi:hypothetical protein
MNGPKGNGGNDKKEAMAETTTRYGLISLIQPIIAKSAKA